jgi:TolA-binding protein
MQKDGEPVQYTDTVTSWLKSSTNGVVRADSVKAVIRCCACLRAPPFSTSIPHHANECGLLATFTKIRKAVGIRPMHVEHGYVDAANKKTQITTERLVIYMEREFRSMKGTIAALNKRIEGLENQKKKKRKLAPASATGKGDVKKTKKGSTAGGAKGSGQTSKKPAGGKDKGKGKAAPAKEGPSGSRFEEVA